MKSRLIHFLSKYSLKKWLPDGDYRAVLIDTEVKVSPFDTKDIIFRYVLISNEDHSRYIFTETFSDNIFICRNAELFCFLESTHIDLEDFSNLIGLVFDAVVQFDFVCGKYVPVLTERRLIACPS